MENTILQWPQIINSTARRPIWRMALGDLTDETRISWEFKSMFSLLCVAGKGQQEHVSVSDPETKTVGNVWTL